MADIRQVRGTMTVADISERLRALALELGPGTKLPTFNELCALLETSRVTLSEVLARLEEQNVIYRLHSKGIFVSPKLHRKTICILLDSSLLAGRSASPFWGTLWELLAREAERRAGAKNEYHCFSLAMRTPEQAVKVPEDVMRMIQANQVHGIIVIGNSIHEYEWISRYHLPCVSFAGYGPWMVIQDFLQLIYLGIQALAEQGCQHIGIWGPAGGQMGNITDHDLSLLPYIFKAYGRAFDPSFVKFGLERWTPADYETISYQEQGYQLALDTFEHPSAPTPDGIVIIDDLMTDGVLSALQFLRIRPGEDVKIVSHANVGSMRFLNHIPGITVIEFDPADIVETMFRLLDTLFSGETPDSPITLIAPKLRS